MRLCAQCVHHVEVVDVGDPVDVDCFRQPVRRRQADKQQVRAHSWVHHGCCVHKLGSSPSGPPPPNTGHPPTHSIPVVNCISCKRHQHHCLLISNGPILTGLVPPGTTSWCMFIRRKEEKSGRVAFWLGARLASSLFTKPYASGIMCSNSYVL